jgi:GT2 family glycosyltransferase
MTRVAVVVITWNRRAGVLETVTRLRALPERPPVVIVDNGSTDATVDALRRDFGHDDDVTVIGLTRNVGAAARNVGAAGVDTPYVAFADDDSWWAPGALPRAADILDRHPNLALIAAKVLVGDDRRVGPLASQMAASALPPLPGTRYPAVLGFVACGAVVRRNAFLDAGGFSELMGIGGEERLLAIDLAAAGWSLAYVDDVVAVHAPASDPRPGRRRRIIRNDLWTAWMRRRPSGAARHTARNVAASVHDPTARAGLLDAARSLPDVLHRRRVVSRDLETRIRLID